VLRHLEENISTLTSQPNYECIVDIHQKAESIFLVRLVLEIELETDFVEPRFSFRVQSVIFEEVTLTEDPIAQLRACLVHLWSIVCNARQKTGGVLVGVFKMKVILSTAQNNSQ
jgi:hypothetical protein